MGVLVLDFWAAVRDCLEIDMRRFFSLLLLLLLGIGCFGVWLESEDVDWSAEFNVRREYSVRCIMVDGVCFDVDPLIRSGGKFDNVDLFEVDDDRMNAITDDMLERDMMMMHNDDVSILGRLIIVCIALLNMCSVF